MSQLRVTKKLVSFCKSGERLPRVEYVDFLALLLVEWKNGLEVHHRRKNGLALKNPRKCDFERYRPCKTRFYGVFQNQHPEKHTSTLFNVQKVTFI